MCACLQPARADVRPPACLLRVRRWLAPPAGGQKKRVNVGLELVADPLLLFLGGWRVVSVVWKQ